MSRSISACVAKKYVCFQSSVRVWLKFSAQVVLTQSAFVALHKLLLSATGPCSLVAQPMHWISSIMASLLGRLEISSSACQRLPWGAIGETSPPSKDAADLSAGTSGSKEKLSGKPDTTKVWRKTAPVTATEANDPSAESAFEPLPMSLTPCVCPCHMNSSLFHCQVSLGFVSMGSLGWRRCFWCWKWRYDMYIVDGLPKPLCSECLDRMDDVGRPPWQPDGRERLRKFWARRLPDAAALCIAEMACPPWQP